MNCCYICNDLLNGSNISVEHIIPNSLGGRLKSKKLLCIKCNNSLGNEIDSELGNQFNVFMNFFMLKREKGKYNSIKGKTENGEEFILDGIDIRSKPKIMVDNIQKTVSFKGNDEKELKIYLKGILKKYPHLDIEEIINTTNKGKYYLNDPININMNFGGEKTFRAISKILVNYYLYSGGEISYIAKFIDYIKGEVKAKKIWFNQEFKHSDLLVTEDNVYHFIKIIGNSTENILYAYIELFGTFKAIALLNDNYDGENIDYQYFFNILKNKEIKTDIKINYTSTDVNSILDVKDSIYLTNKFNESLSSTLKVFQQIQLKAIVKKLIKESFNKFVKNNQEEITKEQLKQITNDVNHSIEVLISRKNQQKGKTYF